MNIKLAEYEQLDEIMGFTLGKTYNLAVESGATTAGSLNKVSKTASLEFADGQSYDFFTKVAEMSCIVQARKVTVTEHTGNLTGKPGQWRILEAGKTSYMDAAEFNLTYKIK